MPAPLADPLPRAGRYTMAGVLAAVPATRPLGPTPEPAEAFPETWHIGEDTAQVFLDAAGLGQRRRHTKGTALYRQGDLGSEFFFVLSGRIQVSVFQQDGTEFILEMMGRHAICGEGAAVDGGPRIATAVALEDVEVIAFDIDVIRGAFASRPDLAMALLRVVAVKQRVLGMRISFMAMPKPELRIGELLRRLAQLYGHPDGLATRIAVALTHEQIAALTGTGRVTVTRALKRLRGEGVIDVQDRRFRILDHARLAI